LPVVTSDVGVNSEFVRDGVTGFVASDTEQWYKRIAEMIEEPGLRKQMGSKAAELVRQFDSKIIGERLISLIRD
jgi:glycosyltransferase involved in cell wall biosynthesis